MFQEVVEFLVQRRPVGRHFGQCPDDQSQHTGESGVAHDDQKGHGQEREGRVPERGHRIGRQSVSQVVERRPRCKGRPPELVHLDLGEGRVILRAQRDPEHEHQHAHDMKNQEI